jgi:hypothetical protein
MIPEATLEQTEHGLTRAGRGSFVLSAGEARWGDYGDGWLAGDGS